VKGLDLMEIDRIIDKTFSGVRIDIKLTVLNIIKENPSVDINYIAELVNTVVTEKLSGIPYAISNGIGNAAKEY